MALQRCLRVVVVESVRFHCAAMDELEAALVAVDVCVGLHVHLQMLVVGVDVGRSLLFVGHRNEHLQTERALQRARFGVLAVEMVDGVALRGAHVVAAAALERHLGAHMVFVHVRGQHRHRCKRSLQIVSRTKHRV